MTSTVGFPPLAPKLNKSLSEAEVSSLLSLRKDLPTNQYSYKLGTGQYGLDITIGDMDIDENEMSMFIPYADGNDRDGVGDQLEVGGIDCSRHIKNPVCLLDHGKQVVLPIGLSEDPSTGLYLNFIDVPAKRARVKCYFYKGNCDKVDGIATNCQKNDHTLLCEQIFDLACKKFLRAGSIGYQVKRAQNLGADYDRGTPPGLHLLSTLMLEASLVVMPANALTVNGKGLDLAREVLSMKRVCGKPLSPYLIKSFGPIAEQNTKVISGYEGKSRTIDTSDWTKEQTRAFSDWLGENTPHGHSPTIHSGRVVSIHVTPGHDSETGQGHSTLDEDIERAKRSVGKSIPHSTKASSTKCPKCSGETYEYWDPKLKDQFLTCPSCGWSNTPKGKAIPQNTEVQSVPLNENLTTTNIPPANWKPGLGAKCKELRKRWGKKYRKGMSGDEYDEERRKWEAKARKLDIIVYRHMTLDDIKKAVKQEEKNREGGFKTLPNQGQKSWLGWLNAMNAMLLAQQGHNVAAGVALGAAVIDTGHELYKLVRDLYDMGKSPDEAAKEVAKYKSLTKSQEKEEDYEVEEEIKKERKEGRTATVLKSIPNSKTKGREYLGSGQTITNGDEVVVREGPFRGRTGKIVWARDGACEIKWDVEEGTTWVRNEMFEKKSMSKSQIAGDLNWLKEEQEEAEHKKIKALRKKHKSSKSIRTTYSGHGPYDVGDRVGYYPYGDIRGRADIVEVLSDGYMIDLYGDNKPFKVRKDQVRDINDVNAWEATVALHGPKSMKGYRRNYGSPSYGSGWLHPLFNEGDKVVIESNGKTGTIDGIKAKLDDEGIVLYYVTDDDGGHWSVSGEGLRKKSMSHLQNGTGGALVGAKLPKKKTCCNNCKDGKPCTKCGAKSITPADDFFGLFDKVGSDLFNVIMDMGEEAVRLFRNLVKGGKDPKEAAEEVKKNKHKFLSRKKTEPEASGTWKRSGEKSLEDKQVRDIAAILGARVSRDNDYEARFNPTSGRTEFDSLAIREAKDYANTYGLRMRFVGGNTEAYVMEKSLQGSKSQLIIKAKANGKWYVVSGVTGEELDGPYPTEEAAYRALETADQEDKPQVEQKSLNLRQKHRTLKNLRRRVKGSKPGVTSMYIDAKDVDAARSMAEGKGCKFHHLGLNNGRVKVKLVGSNESMDEVAKSYGVAMKVLGKKSLPKIKGWAAEYSGSGVGGDTPAKSLPGSSKKGIGYEVEDLLKQHGISADVHPGSLENHWEVFSANPGKVDTILKEAGYQSSVRGNKVEIIHRKNMPAQEVTTAPSTLPDGHELQSIGGASDEELTKRREQDAMNDKKRTGTKAITKCPECGGRIEQDSQGGQCVKCGWRPTDSKKLNKDTKGLNKDMKAQTKELPPDADLDNDGVTTVEEVEKYSAQVLRRLHQDSMLLLEQYDEMLVLLEHEGVKSHLGKKLQALVDDLDEIETLWEKEHGDLPPLEGAGTGEDEVVEEGVEGEAPGEEAVAEEGEVGEKDEPMSDQDRLQGQALESDSDDEEPPPPEDVVEGMEKENKELRIRLTKALRNQYKKGGAITGYGEGFQSDVPGGGGGSPGGGPKVPESDVIKDDDKSVHVDDEEPPCPECGKSPCQCSESNLSKALEPHEHSVVGEAADFCKALTSEHEFGNEHRMKSYYYHKSLEPMSVKFLDADVSVPTGNINVAAPIANKSYGDYYWKSDDALAGGAIGGAIGAAVGGPVGAAVGGGAGAAIGGSSKKKEKDFPPMAEAAVEDANVQAPGEKSYAFHREQLGNAAKYFKELTGTYDFGEPHRQKAMVHHSSLSAAYKALDPMGAEQDEANVQKSDEVEAPADPAGEVPLGDVQEKAAPKAKEVAEEKSIVGNKGLCSDCGKEPCTCKKSKSQPSNRVELAKQEKDLRQKFLRTNEQVEQLIKSAKHMHGILASANGEK